MSSIESESASFSRDNRAGIALIFDRASNSWISPSFAEFRKVCGRSSERVPSRPVRDCALLFHRDSRGLIPWIYLPSAFSVSR